jgi:ribonucleoside-diphosphate reductase alpha chain
VELAKEKGAFPLFDRDKYLQSKFIKDLPNELQESIAKYGIRNSHLTSIAPTGTISIAADNVSSGIEPVFSLGYMRKINLPGGPVEEFFSDYAWRNFETKPKTAMQLTATEHLNVLLTAQKFVDSAVSKTCNVNPHMPWEDFKQLYYKAWQGGAKGLSTFNPKGKRMGILEAVDDKEPVDDEQEGMACTFDPLTGGKTCG